MADMADQQRQSPAAPFQLRGASHEHEQLNMLLLKLEAIQAAVDELRPAVATLPAVQQHLRNLQQ